MAHSDYPTARPFLPDDRDLDNLARAAEGCQGCPLYHDATQTVFGVGPSDAQLMLVGEQPGAEEDRVGEPFVGQAGKMLDRSLEAAGVQRSDVYITNAVKHFKSKGGDGSRRGVKPQVGEVHACRPWLESELEAVQPLIVVAMGTVAARSLIGQPVTIGESLGAWLQTAEGRHLIVTYHPSAALRAPAKIDRERIFETLVDDLARAHEAISQVDRGARPGR